MNKEQIFEAFYNVKVIPVQVKNLIVQSPEFLTQVCQEPSNFQMEKVESETIKEDNKSSKSGFSKIDLSMEKYQSLLKERDHLKIFESLSEKENINKKVWFYKDHKGEIHGPFNAIQMDEFYSKSKIINEDCFVQGPTESEFIPLRIILRRYLKYSFVSKNKEMSSILNGKDQVRNHSKTAGLLIERKYRVLSLEVKSNLSFLDEITEENEYTDILQSRNRSSTMAQ